MSFIIENGVLKKYYSENPEETDIVIPEGVTTIGVRAFERCDSLKSVQIPDSVISIEDEAFSDCANLKSIVIPNSVKSIGEFAFIGCVNLESVTINEGVEVIGTYAFSDCFNLTSIVIPGSVKKLEDRVFECCYRLKEVVISNGVTSIAEDAFNNCYELDSVVFPESVMGIDKPLYDTQWYKEQPDGLVITNYDDVCGYKGEMDEDGEIYDNIIIPDGVKEIQRYSLWKCRGSIEIPESVISIESDAFGDVCILLHENGYHINVRMDEYWDSWNGNLSNKFLNELGITQEEYLKKHGFTDEHYLNEFWFTKDAIKRQAIFEKMKKIRYKIPMAILMAVSHEEDEFFHTYVKNNIQRAVEHLILFNDLENLEYVLNFGYVTKNHIHDLMDYTYYQFRYECTHMIHDYGKRIECEKN